jgi:hypothetical protein
MMPTRNLIFAGSLAMASVVLLAAEAAHACPDPSLSFSDNTPLDDLGAGMYEGAQGGLYPGGSNDRPVAHENAGVALTSEVVPRNAAGEPDPQGAIGFVSIGMSNTRDGWDGFMDTIAGDGSINSSVVFVNGGFGGQGAAYWTSPQDMTWTMLDQNVAAAGLSADQVQVVWIKQQFNGDNLDPFPQGAQELRDALASIVTIARQRFPNLRLAYLSSRTYGHYAPNRGQSAYESAWSVKWLIEDQIDGDPALEFEGNGAPAPWLSWGPYLWADGEGPDKQPGGQPGRSDGLEWVCADYGNDGTHPTNAGGLKVGQLLDDFFRTDSTSNCWYLDGPACEPDPGGDDGGTTDGGGGESGGEGGGSTSGPATTGASSAGEGGDDGSGDGAATTGADDTSPGSDGQEDDDTADSGCGCRHHAPGPSAWWLGLAAVGARQRRRRTPVSRRRGSAPH